MTVKLIQLKGKPGFRIVGRTPRSQAAEMVLAATGYEGGPDNRHFSDQWLYVISGNGLAIVNGRGVPLGAGSLLLIEKGDHHEIRTTGRAPLKTMNVYAPPAY